MMGNIVRRLGEKLKKKGVEINLSVKIGQQPKIEERKIIKPIYFIDKEKEECV